MTFEDVEYLIKATAHPLILEDEKSGWASLKEGSN